MTAVAPHTRTGRDTQQVRIGQRVAHQGLHTASGQGESGPDDDRQQCPGSTQIPDDDIDRRVGARLASDPGPNRVKNATHWQWFRTNGQRDDGADDDEHDEDDHQGCHRQPAVTLGRPS